MTSSTVENVHYTKRGRPYQPTKNEYISGQMVTKSLWQVVGHIKTPTPLPRDNNRDSYCYEVPHKIKVTTVGTAFTDNTSVWDYDPLLKVKVSKVLPIFADVCVDYSSGKPRVAKISPTYVP